MSETNDAARDIASPLFDPLGAMERHKAEAVRELNSEMGPMWTEAKEKALAKALMDRFTAICANFRIHLREIRDCDWKKPMSIEERERLRIRFNNYKRLERHAMLELVNIEEILKGKIEIYQVLNVPRLSVIK